MKLFRTEAIEAQRRRLWGEVRISQPPSLTTWTIVIGLVCIIFFASLWFVSFSRRETVAGELVPTGGVIQIVAPRSGNIANVSVMEGERVRAGEQMFELADTSNAVASGPVLDLQIRELRVQQRAIAERRQASLASIASERQRIENQIAGAVRELESTAAAVDIQSDVESLSARDLERVTDLNKDGYAPKTEVDRRRRKLLEDRSTLVQMRGARDRLATTVHDLRAQLSALSPRQATELAMLASEEGALGQRLSEMDLAQRQSVRATVNGTVSYQSATAGQMVQAGQPLAAIVPDGVPLEAYIYVPTKSAGFMRVGQKTRLRIQAFPYQRFGFVDGEIRSIARSVSPVGDPSLPRDIKEAVYRVRVKLRRQTIDGDGAPQSLQPGMLLTADVETDRRRLWQQLFDPLIAAGKLAAG